jgi:ABC-2 type transport system permease protein
VAAAATTTLDPGVTWGGWRVPDGLSLGLVAVLGVLLLGLAIAEFCKTD